MHARKVVFVVPVALLLAAAACNVKNVEVHGSYRDAGIHDAMHPIVAEMFNLAFKAVKLPSAAVAAGEYVAVYRLSSGKAEGAWWSYFAEDWIVDKVRAAGATPVERNGAAVRLLGAEGAYVEGPAGDSPTGTTSRRLGRAGETPAELTPYRATRALAYRVVAADLWFDRFNRHGPNGEPTVRANAKVTVNLRTLDVRTGEILWSGTAAGSARKNVEVSRLLGWFGIDDWDDWDDWDDGPFMWHWDWGWDHGSPGEAEPDEGVPADKYGDDDGSTEEPEENGDPSGGTPEESEGYSGSDGSYSP